MVAEEAARESRFIPAHLRQAWNSNLEVKGAAMTRQVYDKAFGGTAPENYERYFVPSIGAPLAEDLVRTAALRPGERVLDVACGTGVVTRLARRAISDRGSVAGLDVNPGMLAVARSATPPDLAIDWYESSAEAMPLADGAFDVVLCQMGLQFIPDKAAALREMRRVLSPEGRVVLNLPGPTPPPFAILADGLGKHIAPQASSFVHAVFSLHNGDEIRELMRSAGFRSVEVHTTKKTLRLPPPREFLWQYVGCTPLAAAVAQATSQARAALEQEVCARWQDFLVDGGLAIEVDMTTATGG
jgi:ubiquinone/menaquinone biosynthesis C-methylase UbiE